MPWFGGFQSAKTNFANYKNIGTRVVRKNEINIIIKLVLMLAAAIILSCEPESHRNNMLRKEIERRNRQLEVLQQNMQQIANEVTAIWIRSLKYRYPDIQPIINQEIAVKSARLPFIQKVRFRYKTNHHLLFTCNYKSNQDKLRPEFDIFLFDKYGINIHRQHIQYKGRWIRRYLKQGEEKDELYPLKIVSTRTPLYFLLREKQ